jgi:4'-phosphopantetheinyl transferase EntD
MGLIKTIIDDEVQVALWQIDETEAQLVNLTGADTSLLPPNPRRRIEKMVVRAILGQLGIDDPVGYDHKGRPVLGSGSLDISISHAKHLVAVALSGKGYVGVDVEQIDRKFGNVLAKYTTGAERLWVRPDSKPLMALVWCVKEAIFKLPWRSYLVFGEHVELAPVSNLGDNDFVIVRVVDDGLTYSLKVRYLFANGYCLAWVCRYYV